MERHIATSILFVFVLLAAVAALVGGICLTRQSAPTLTPSAHTYQSEQNNRVVREAAGTATDYIYPNAAISHAITLIFSKYGLHIPDTRVTGYLDVAHIRLGSVDDVLNLVSAILESMDTDHIWAETFVSENIPDFNDIMFSNGIDVLIGIQDAVEKYKFLTYLFSGLAIGLLCWSGARLTFSPGRLRIFLGMSLITAGFSWYLFILCALTR